LKEQCLFKHLIACDKELNGLDKRGKDYVELRWNAVVRTIATIERENTKICKESQAIGSLPIQISAFALLNVKAPPIKPSRGRLKVTLQNALEEIEKRCKVPASATPRAEEVSRVPDSDVDVVEEVISPFAHFGAFSYEAKPKAAKAVGKPKPPVRRDSVDETEAPAAQSEEDMFAEAPPAPSSDDVGQASPPGSPQGSPVAAVRSRLFTVPKNKKSTPLSVKVEVAPAPPAEDVDVAQASPPGSPAGSPPGSPVVRAVPVRSKLFSAPAPAKKRPSPLAVIAKAEDENVEENSPVGSPT